MNDEEVQHVDEFFYLCGIFTKNRNKGGKISRPTKASKRVEGCKAQKKQKWLSTRRCFCSL